MLSAQYCVTLADSNAINRVSKAWVPKEYDREQLWFSRDEVFDNNIKKLESLWNPAKTLRTSIIEGKELNNVQLMIPPGLLNSNGGSMGLTASCKERIEDIPGHIVKYNDWKYNIKGKRQ
ncbi:hypothetical protein W97_07727 [Coniosporium apollinis CBS 100218]|uniref:Uncharacterized protein n=1 Tax=Coniosporium apollinis (strain CBS 100218) TaxID=1168221 RepID=R7Z2T3_CONA1|nr:uncharacterized protein W97_07727 [Coniosporium apollinis CBS 100218]EON68403.1 hypothetical protein W97_07727 [Coniosporium apollinis CBS 100218]